MVQKSGVHQLRLVVYSIIYNGFSTIPRAERRISEPSTLYHWSDTLFWKKTHPEPWILKQLCLSSFFELHISVWSFWSQINGWCQYVWCPNLMVQQDGPKNQFYLGAHNSTYRCEKALLTSFPSYQAIYKCFVWLHLMIRPGAHFWLGGVQRKVGVKKVASKSAQVIGFLRGGSDSPNLPQCSLRFPNLF